VCPPYAAYSPPPTTFSTVRVGESTAIRSGSGCAGTWPKAGTDTKATNVLGIYATIWGGKLGVPYRRQAMRILRARMAHRRSSNEGQESEFCRRRDLRHWECAQEDKLINHDGMKRSKHPVCRLRDRISDLAVTT